MAIVHQARVNVRLQMLFWHLADRWGRVYPSGVRLSLPLTHRLLGQLVAAERPSISHALKRLAQDPAHPLGQDEAWREALLCVLGEEAADLEELARRKRRAMGGQHSPLGLGDLFFNPDDPLHPDADEDDDEDEEDFDEDKDADD